LQAVFADINIDKSRSVHYWLGGFQAMIQATRADIQRCLRSYGEDSVATKLEGVSDEDFKRIGERAFDYACQPSTPSGRGMLLAKALALASVEVIEGAPRELRLKKRAFL
jgi:hypothetical protein